MSDDPSTDEARRLEDLWAGDFGDSYVDRNLDAYAAREGFWRDRYEQLGLTSVLEIGCNVGGNLQWLAGLIEPGRVFGVDVNRKAISALHQRVPDANAIWSPGRDLPFRERWFDLVFTMGVLIHQPEASLPLVMSEMVRCSGRYVLCGEYFAEQTEEVAYHGQSGALFRRDYGRLFREQFPELTEIDRGFLGRDEGWDDITWWVFERR